MHRGEVWWADLAPPLGRRPVLLLTREAAFYYRSSITVAPTTRTIRNIPIEVYLSEEDGLPKKCVVNCDNILTVPKTTILDIITQLSPEKMEEVALAVNYALSRGF